MKFNGPEFSARMTQILLSGDYKRFETILKETIYPPEESNRISKLLSLRRDVEDSINRNYPNAKKIHLSEFENKSTYLESVSVNELLRCEDGLYSEKKNQIHISTFDIDMKRLSPQTIKRLRDCRFDAKIHYAWNYKYRVLSNVQFCTEHYNLYACISNGRFYDRTISARLAKSCYINFVRDYNEIIDMAIILPVPHHIKNYYHVMTEMVYALRNCIDNNIPIIYPDDHFKIIPFISKKLDINICRFISFPEARNILIKKAVIPYPPSFTWDDSFFNFFRGLIGHENKDKDESPIKIYVSRSRSSRGPKNEIAVEDALIRNGFIIIHPEFLDIEHQAIMFSSASIIVAPHGAGLTNIAFSSKGVALIELFSSDFLCRDFYLRTRHNKSPYYAIIYDESLDPQEIITAAEKITSDKD